MNLKFTYSQRVAVFSLARMIAYADGTMHNDEFRYACTVFKKIGMDEEEFVTLSTNDTKLSSGSISQTIRAMSSEQRKFIAAFLMVMTAVDGDISQMELVGYVAIATECNLPDLDFDEAKRIMTRIIG